MTFCVPKCLRKLFRFRSGFKQRTRASRFELEGLLPAARNGEIGPYAMLSSHKNAVQFTSSNGKQYREEDLAMSQLRSSVSLCATPCHTPTANDKQYREEDLAMSQPHSSVSLSLSMLHTVTHPQSCFSVMLMDRSHLPLVIVLPRPNFFPVFASCSSGYSVHDNLI
jgi:hypothetical protein